jgi:DNA-binding transcriptional regulator YhcF (GntR family)
MNLTAVLWLIRDSRSTRNAERNLLYALALRVNPSKGYHCWPSYEQLALDTCCNEATLKKAAASLEKKGLIKRKLRHNRANKFTINIEKLKEQAKLHLASDLAKKQALDGEDSEEYESTDSAAHDDDGEDDSRKNHLHINHATLLAFRETGILELPEEDQNYLGFFRFTEEDGTYYGRKIEISSRWTEIVENVAADGECVLCLGTNRLCITSMDTEGDTLTFETDKNCPQCVEVLG